MSEPKTIDISIFKVGTAVWVKAVNRVWWPGIIVDPLTCPQELIDYMKKINSIIVVKYQSEDKYEVIDVNSKIFLYSCERKDEFIEKGFSLYKNQMKGKKIVGDFDMNNFKNDTIHIERLIGGNIHIFENLEAKQESLKFIVKRFFTPTSTKKSKKKEVDRKSLPVPKPRTSRIPDQPNPVSRPKTPTQSNVSNKYKPSTSTGYSCHSQIGCNFRTNRYDNLKRHMTIHKSGTDVVTTKKPSTRSSSIKRKNVKATSSEVKKQKLQEELLKDWDNDGEEEDENPNASEPQPSCSNAAQSSNETVVQTGEPQPSCSNVAQSSNETVVQTSEPQPSCSNVAQSSNETVVQTSEVPSSSNVQPLNKAVVQTSEVPSSSNVQSSNEEVVQTNEVPSSSNVQPLNKAVVQTSEVPSSSNVQPSNEEVVQTSEVPSSNNVQSSNEEVVQTSEVPSSNNVQPSNEEVVQTSEVPSSSNVQPSNEEVVQTLSEVISATSEDMPTSKVLSVENDIIPSISKNIPREKEVQETIASNPNHIFDFNENDNNTPVVELRQSKSDFSSTVDDDISETFESQITPDFISNTIFDALPSESLLVEKTIEDSINKSHEINSSNELENEIDNQTKSTELLLEKTVNTLDQITNFENSLSCISGSINNSDANISTEDNNVVIGVSELSVCGSLNKIASPYKSIHIETNGIEIQQVENKTTETEDHAIVEENTNVKEIASNDIDVNQLNGATVDKDMSIENSCSVNCTSNKMDFEDKMSKKKVCLIDNIPKSEWAKGDDWDFTHEELKKADFVYYEEKKYIPPTTASLTTGRKSLSERLKFSRESKLDTQVQPEYILDTKGGFDVFIPIGHDLSYPIMEEVPPDVITSRKICQKASMENSFLQLNCNDKVLTDTCT